MCNTCTGYDYQDGKVSVYDFGRDKQDTEDHLLKEDLYTRENRGRIFIVFKEQGPLSIFAHQYTKGQRTN